MQPYMTGTITGTVGTTAVTGTSTLWNNTVHEGDLLVANNKIYPIKTITDETHLTLYTELQETLTNSAYYIARTASNWGSNADVAAKVTETMDLYKNKLKNTLQYTYVAFTIAPDDWEDYVDSALETNYRVIVEDSEIKYTNTIDIYLEKSCCVEVADCNVIITPGEGQILFYARQKPTVTISGQLRVII